MSSPSQLLSIGKQCSHPSCNLIDFLPFKCHHCGDHFCQEHFKVAAHACPKYDETKHNRVAPDCTLSTFFTSQYFLSVSPGPLCNTPVAVRPEQDPNIRMSEHIDNECSVTTGKDGRARSTPVCARPNCKKVLFSPIRCDVCPRMPFHLLRKTLCIASRNAETNSALHIGFPAITIVQLDLSLQPGRGCRICSTTSTSIRRMSTQRLPLLPQPPSVPSRNPRHPPQYPNLP